MTVPLDPVALGVLIRPFFDGFQEWMDDAEKCFPGRIDTNDINPYPLPAQTFTPLDEDDTARFRRDDSRGLLDTL